MLDTVLVGPLVSALHIHAVIDIGRGEQPQLGEVTVRALRVLPVVVAAVIASALMIALGFVALIVPGVLLALGWAVVAQVAAVDNDGWLPALRRSRELTRGHYRPHLRPAHHHGHAVRRDQRRRPGDPARQHVGCRLGRLGIATRTITASFSALTLALLYFDLRARGARRARRAARPAEQRLERRRAPDSGAGEESPDAGAAEEPLDSGAAEAGPDPGLAGEGPGPASPGEAGSGAEARGLLRAAGGVARAVGVRARAREPARRRRSGTPRGSGVPSNQHSRISRVPAA